MKNLYKHIDNLKNIFGQNVIVAINKFNTDTVVELDYLKEELSKRNIKVSIVESWAKGGNGAIDIAQKIVNMPESQTIKYCYDLNDSIVDKVRKVAQNVYGAENVIFSDETMKKVQNELFTLYKNSPQFGALKSSVRYDVLYSFEAEVIQKKDFYEDYITDISSVEKTNVPLSINAIEYKDELVIEISYDNSIELEILDFVDRWEKTLNKYGKEKNVQTDSYRHAIIEAWKDVLQVDIDDDLSNEATFFDLGGNSLQLFSLLKKLNIEYDFDVSLTELLENQSLMQLQKVLKKKHQY